MSTFAADSKGRQVIDKDPNASLDYNFDWTTWLSGVSDSIASFEIIYSGVVEAKAATRSGGVVTAWAKGGTVGDLCSITCRITTTAGRIEDRTGYLKIKER